MKNTLWTFGDSLTDGFRSDHTWATDYVKWKGYVPKTYGEIISNQLGMNLINLGKGGSDNDTIFETFCKNIKNIKKDDIVIIGWSTIGRFRLADIHNGWKSFVPNFSNITNMEDVSISTINEILVNRMSRQYINELNILINFLNHIITDFKIIHWSAYDDGKTNSHYAAFCEKIWSETNHKIDDGHFTEKGHIELSNFLIDIINNNRKLL